MLELRDYQTEALAKVADAERRGVRRLLGVAATGLGKTVVFTALARSRPDTRTLILAHRDELVDQAIAKVREVWPGQTVGKVKASDNQIAAHVVVASVQTLAREARLRRLAEFDGGLLTAFAKPAPWGLVVVDEAHHATADTYRRILTTMRAGEPDGPLLLGVTATPDRGDGKGLRDVFEEIAFVYDLHWGIRHGYLSDLRGVRVSVEMDLSGVKVRRGDYDAGQTAALLEAAGAPEHIVDAWQAHAADRRTLVFTPTVDMADHVRAAFVDRGIPAVWVHGGMDAAERARNLRAYSTGEAQVMTNCAVLTEGFDAPRTDCVVVARPTKSRALYAQMVGRGTRLHPDKADCLVLDVVEASRAHSLLTVPSLFGIRAEHEHQVAAEGAAVVAERQAQLDVREGRLRAEEAELFHTVRRSGLAWVQVHDREDGRKRYALNLGRTVGSLVLLQTVEGDDESWLVGHRNGDGHKAVLQRDVSLSMAQGIAEEAAKRLAPNAWYIADARANWRTRPPSEAQRNAAARWRVPVRPGMTAGDLADQINARIEVAANRRGRRRR